MISVTKQTPEQLATSFAQAAVEYERAWKKHPNINLPFCEVTMEAVKARLQIARAMNDSGHGTYTSVFAEEFLEMIEAAGTLDLDAFRTELAQCHAVLERMNDFVTSFILSRKGTVNVNEQAHH